MKIGFFKLEEWEKAAVKAADFSLLNSAQPVPVQVGNLTGRAGVEVIFIDEILSKEHLPAVRDFDVVSVFVDSAVDAEVIAALPNLKFIATRSTGFDHVDVKACAARGIKVAYVPAYGENTVAEFTFALLLALSRKIFVGFDRIKETGSFSTDGLRGFDLKDKTLGVVGTGRIGRHVARMARGFEMNIVAYDAKPDEGFAATNGFRYLPFDELLKISDVVTLHVPYTKETHHLINKEKLELMKPGAYIINTSRGAIIETEALVLALTSGHLGGAGLDVLEEEGVVRDELDFLAHGHPEEHNLKTILADHILIDLPNVIITPHNAFNTQEALARILGTTIENIKGFLNGKMVNLVQ